MLDLGEQHAQLFDRKLFSSGLVKNVTAEDAKGEGLVCNLALKSVW